MIIKETFPITGLSCTSCASSVEKRLKSTEGVKDASVNFVTSTAFAEYDDEKMSPEKLQNAVQSIGYNLVIDSK